MANNKRDYYEVLGVDRNADADTIKKAFRKLSIRYHPDKQVGKSDEEKKAAEEKFKEVAEAYSVLSDENKKKQYDTYGFNMAPNGGGYDFSHFDMGDFFGNHSSFFGGFSDLFGDTFGGFGNFGQTNWYDVGGARTNHATQIKQGGDLRITLKLTLQEMVHGCNKKIKYKHFVGCSHCSGTGSVDGTDDICLNCGGTGKKVNIQKTSFGMTQTITVCPDCGGTGRVIKNKCRFCNGTGLEEKEETVDIRIPAGSMKNSMITLHGLGNAPKNGGNKNSFMGNLLVIIDEIPDERFTHDGRNLYYDLLLDIPTATLGGDVYVPLLDGGQYKVHINAGTQPGSKITLEKMGLPINGSMYNVGDYIIRVNIYMPENLSSSEKKIFEKLKKSENVKK